jgi:hypothetical protein
MCVLYKNTDRNNILNMYTDLVKTVYITHELW